MRKRNPALIAAPIPKPVHSSRFPLLPQFCPPGLPELAGSCCWETTPGADKDPRAGTVQFVPQNGHFTCVSDANCWARRAWPQEGQENLTPQFNLSRLKVQSGVSNRRPVTNLPHKRSSSQCSAISRFPSENRSHSMPRPLNSFIGRMSVS